MYSLQYTSVLSKVRINLWPCRYPQNRITLKQILLICTCLQNAEFTKLLQGGKVLQKKSLPVGICKIPWIVVSTVAPFDELCVDSVISAIPVSFPGLLVVPKGLWKRSLRSRKVYVISFDFVRTVLCRLFCSIWVFQDRRFCQIIWQIFHREEQKKFRQKFPPVAFETRTSRSSGQCLTNWARQESVGQEISEVSFVSCTTSHVGLHSFLESIDHDFIKAMKIQASNWMLT